MSQDLLVDLGNETNWAKSPIPNQNGELNTHGIQLAVGQKLGEASMWRAPVGNYSSPGAPVAEVFMVRSGEAIVRIRGAEHVLTAGAVFVLPANEPFSFDVTAEFSKFAVTITP